ncbi:MAG: hypothetical protein QOK17_2393 [Sphingomonadales bacterium]|jgi:DNA-binding PadR family transcriptional regulator|nr:hypothetical protein [Sphingomonadales bacterium]
MGRTAGYDITISFVAPTFDRRRMEQVIHHHFGAEDVNITIELHPEAATVRHGRLPTWEPKPGTGAAELLSLVRERGVIRSREFKHIANVRAALALLLMDGHIEKVRHGVYKAGGLDVAVEEKIGRSHPLGPRQQQIVDALATPHTAAELRELAGVSRQAIDQLLKKLMKEGRIRRIPTATETSDWLYVRSGHRDIDAIAARTPSLTRTERNLLNLLPSTGGARGTALNGRLGPGYRVVLRRLVVKGLVEDVGTPKRRVVRLTRKGLQHPAYEHDREHLDAIDETAAFKPAYIKLMLALDALGEARALDLTDVSGLKPKRRCGTGQHLQRLRVTGYVEQSKVEGRAPLYRLTKQGLAAISTAKAKGRSISRREAQKRLLGARAARKLLQSGKQTRASLGALRSSRTPELLSIVLREPGLRAPEIHGRLSRPYADEKSAYVALTEFERRGLVERTQLGQRAPVQWSITATGSAMLAEIMADPHAPDSAGDSH